jgi:hypothetical protein
VTATAICAAALAGPAYSQSQPQPRSDQKAVEQVKARFQISLMEGVLERAVENAARVLNVQLRPIMPGMFLLGSTGARARGFRLEGYGVFFDVEVPGVRPFAWSQQILGAPDQALKSLREHVRTITNVKEREQLDRALRQIEIQFPAPAGTEAASPGAATKTPQASAIDTFEAYDNAVTTAIVDSMLDYGGPLQISGDEWLTVAARDYEGQRSLAPDTPYDLVTIVMRIKGSDLQAFRAGRLTREEARKRVEQREF